MLADCEAVFIGAALHMMSQNLASHPQTEKHAFSQSSLNMIIKARSQGFFPGEAKVQPKVNAVVVMLMNLDVY